MGGGVAWEDSHRYCPGEGLAAIATALQRVPHARPTALRRGHDADCHIWRTKQSERRRWWCRRRTLRLKTDAALVSTSFCRVSLVHD